VSNSTEGDLERLPWRISPSRAADFKQCALKFKFGTIDKLRTPSTPEQLRGTLTHEALEQLFMHPRGERTKELALSYIAPAWERIRLQDDVAHIVEQGQEAEADIIAYAERMVSNYFSMENPNVFDPAGLEIRLAADVLGVPLHGIIDRLDRVVMPSGEVRWYISDYKGLALDTVIPTPAGWSTMAELSVGDQVFGADGKPCTVTIKSGIHHRPCYEIVFDDGAHITCDNVHLWTVQFQDSSAARWVAETLDTDSLYDRWQAGEQTVGIFHAQALELPDMDLADGPYLVGRRLVAASIARRDALVSAGSSGRECTPVEDVAVPDVYLRASREQRISLLEGIFGVGLRGSMAQVAEVNLVFSGSVGVARVVHELVCSLGGAASVSGEGGSVKVAVTLPGRGDAAQMRTIVSITPVDSVPTACIQVDAADSLYLAGPQMVPTHNTGKVPKPDDRFLDEKFFAMKLYAVLAKEMLGIDVHELRLVYLAGGSKDAVRTMPVTSRLVETTSKQIKALWKGITNAARTGNWTAKQHVLCSWCDFQEICPVWHPELEGVELSDLVEHANETGVALRLGSRPTVVEETQEAEGD
jgi:RecB family exonuclease